MLSESEAVAGVNKGLFIGGAWVRANAQMDVEDPSTGEVLCQVADASPDEAMAALAAADAAQAQWGQSSPGKRAEILRRAYELMVSETERLAMIMTLEMGKSLAESRGEVAYAAAFLDWFAGQAVRSAGEYRTTPQGSSRILTLKQPVGVALMITPWNFPLAMGTRKIAPAIAAGCASVIKPAAQTPLCTLAFADILQRAGLPAGVVNVVTTSHAGEAMTPLIEDPRSKKLSFTGSTGVGKALLATAAKTVMRTSMELGGNAPFIVFADADIDAAVQGAMAAKMRNIGQACTAANRLLVHEDIAEEFTTKLTSAMKELGMGRGVDDGVSVGPLIDEKAVAKVSGLVDDAARRGATVLLGGQAVGGPGHFYPATVVTGVREDMELSTVEIFGPVAAIQTFATEVDAIRLANATQYGLISYMYTQDFARALRVAEALESGMVGVNKGVISNAAAPFGGIKESGIGREGGIEGIEEYQETKYVGFDL